jgi:DNA-binding CsgD family transcriptional regulator/tetratricopeptide (TPR) repeat protein
MAQTAERLVGRGVELERLERCVARARAGVRATVLVEGVAGIGKSRLVRETLTSLREPGDVLAVGHGVELSGGELPYGTASDSLRSLVRNLGADEVRGAAGEAASALAAICPPLGRGDGDTDLVQLFGGFVSTLETLAAERMVWLVIEDLHWADTTSRDLVGYLVRVAGPCRLLTIVTVRSDDPATGHAASDFVSDLARVDGVDRVRLEPLTRDQMCDQMAELTSGTPSRALLDRVAALSQGNPFLTEQLVAAGVRETGPVPKTVLEPMLARVRRLDPDTRRLVQLASLADGHLGHAILAQAFESEAGSEPLGSAIAQAMDAQMLRFRLSDHTYTFTHALLREAVDASVLPADRLRWHRRWAELLSRPEHHADDPRVRIAAAHHWAHAGADAEAFDAAVEAARFAARVGAMAEVAALLRRLLDLWDRVPDAADRADRTRDDVLDDTVRALDASSGTRDALALLDAELQRVVNHVDGGLRDLCLRLTRDWVASELGEGEDEELYVEAAASIDALIEAPPSAFVFEALQALGWHLKEQQPDQSYRLQSRALEVANELDDVRRRRWATSTLASHLGEDARFDEALEMCAALLPAVTDVTEVVYLETHMGVLLSQAGRYREAVVTLDRAASRLADPHLAPHAWEWSRLSLCDVLLAVGEWDRADAELGRVRELRLDSPWLFLGLALATGMLACWRGDAGRAESWARTAKARMPPDGQSYGLWGLVTMTWLDAEICFARGDLSAARAALAPLWQTPGVHAVDDAWHPLLLAARIEAELASRSGAPSAELVDTCSLIRSVADQMPRAGDLGATWYAQVRADLSWALGNGDDTDWTTVVEAWRRLGHPHNLAWSLLRHASACVRNDDRDGAAESISAALQVADRLRAAPVREAAFNLARRGRIQLSREPGAPTHAGTARLRRLTSRELVVLQLVAQGMSNEEIAQSLFISPKTASVHVSRILTKLGVTSRAKATAVAYEEGIFSDRV